MEVEQRDGRLLYHGLFREGSGDNFLTTPLHPGAFREMRDDQVARGPELVDMEVLPIDPRGRIVGVRSSGPGESRISNPRTFGAHFVFSQAQLNDDKHAVDFELRVACDEIPETSRIT